MVLIWCFTSVPIPSQATLIFRVHLGQVCMNFWVQLSPLVDLESLTKEAGIYWTTLLLLYWKECNSQHIVAPSYIFFPSTEQKYVLNIFVVLYLTVLIGYILFLMYLKSSFLSLLKKASNVSSYRFPTVSFYSITDTFVYMY